jgi:hypothetical protein
MYRNVVRFIPMLPEDSSIGGSIPSFATVGVASSLILQPQFNRKSLVLVNDSPNLIYLSKTDPAVIGSGIRLNPNGGAYWEPDAAGRVWLGAWYAIAALAGSNLAITEDW